MAERADLNVLRGSASTAPDLDPIIDEIYKSAQWVHIDFLFNPSWSHILSKILRMVTGTKNAWKMLAHYLGLSTEEIKCIQEMTRTKDEDQTYYTLVAYSDKPDATFGRLLKCLQQAGLYTVLQETHEPIQMMIKNELGPIGDKTVVTKPKYKLVQVPKCLTYLENISQTKLDKTIEETISDRCKEKFAEIQKFDDNNMRPAAHIQNQVLVHRQSQLASITEKTVPVKERPQYFQIVLVTYADDGVEIVKKILDLFLNSYPRVGVLTLEKNRELVYENNDIIFKFCKKANYIIPVITKNYLKCVMDRTENKDESYQYLDHKYAQMIYDWYRGNYINKACLNKNIRCVIPDGFIKSEVWKEHIDNLCFQVWFEENNLKSLYDRIVYNCDELDLYIPRELPEEEPSTSDTKTSLSLEKVNYEKKKKKFLSFKMFTITKRTRKA